MESQENKDLRVHRVNPAHPGQTGNQDPAGTEVNLDRTEPPGLQAAPDNAENQALLDLQVCTGVYSILSFTDMGKPWKTAISRAGQANCNTVSLGPLNIDSR